MKVMVTDSTVKAATALSMACQYLALNGDYSFYIDFSRRKGAMYIVGLKGCQCEELYKSLFRVLVRDFTWKEDYDARFDFWSISIDYLF